MPAVNPNYSAADSIMAPAYSLVSITPNDGADLAIAVRMIYVGGAGDVCVVDTQGNTVTHVSVSSGSYIGPFAVARVKATSTTATNLVGYV